MRLQQVDLLSVGSGVMAGPQIVRRVVEHARVHRVEFDAAHAGEQVLLIGHQASFITAFPQPAVRK